MKKKFWSMKSLFVTLKIFAISFVTSLVYFGLGLLAGAVAFFSEPWILYPLMFVLMASTLFFGGWLARKWWKWK